MGEVSGLGDNDVSNSASGLHQAPLHHQAGRLEFHRDAIRPG